MALALFSKVKTGYSAGLVLVMPGSASVGVRVERWARGDDRATYRASKHVEAVPDSYGRAEVGTPKARALANSLYRAVQAKVEPVAVEFTPKNAAKLLGGSAVVVDAFDNREGRATVSETARKLALPCLHIGFSGDGLYGSGIWEPHYQIPQQVPGDPCDYPLTRPLACILAALTARAIVEFLRDGQHNETEFTWNDAKITYTTQDI